MAIIYDFADINARLVNGFREPVQQQAPPAVTIAGNGCHTHTLTAAQMPCHTHGLSGLNNIAAQGALQSLYNNALGGQQLSGLAQTLGRAEVG